MASATYLFLTYLIPLLYGQLDAAVPSNSTQSQLAASPSGKMSQPSSNIHLQPSLITSEVKSPIQSFIGRTATSLLKSSQPVLNTTGNERNNFSTTGTVPMPSLTLNESGVYSSSYPIMVHPSKQVTSGSDKIADSGQLSTATTTQEVTSTTISQSLIVITSGSPNVLVGNVTASTTSKLSVSVQNNNHSTGQLSTATTTQEVTSTTISQSNVITSGSPNVLVGNVTASTTSKLSVSVQNNNHSTQILVSPALETPSNNISRSSSIPKVKPGLTSSPNGLPIPSVSKVNMTSSSSNVKLRSSTVTPSPTSSKMKLNQTSSSTAVPNLSSSNVKLKPNGSTMVISHPSSVQYIPNISSTHSINVTSSPVITVKPTSASEVVQTAISVALNSSHLLKSIMSSPPLSSQSITSTVFPTSVLSPYRSSYTVTIEASCNNLLTCSITLQPSATMQYTSMGSGTALSSSLSNILNRNASSFMSSSTVSGMNTSSVLHPEKTTHAPGSEDKEESHTPLIIGLAVGLSLGMVLIIVIIVYYRRKRSSYQYNVFYDEQNIVMQPFDYSK